MIRLGNAFVCKSCRLDEVAVRTLGTCQRYDLRQVFEYEIRRRNASNLPKPKQCGFGPVGVTEMNVRIVKSVSVTATALSAMMGLSFFQAV